MWNDSSLNLLSRQVSRGMVVVVVVMVVVMVDWYVVAKMWLRPFDMKANDDVSNGFFDASSHLYNSARPLVG